MHAELIGGIVPVGVETPGMLKRLILEESDREVRIADVDREEH
jgi:hypothetical protein